LYPVLDAEQRVVSVITRKDLKQILGKPGLSNATIGSFARRAPAIAFANEPLRLVVSRMAEMQFTRMPVTDPDDGDKLVGMVSLEDLLSGRTRAVTEERTRERVLRLRLPRLKNRASLREAPAAAGPDSDDSGPTRS
jgi:CBS-domain-containing membrane protein